MAKAKILVVDDDQSLLHMLQLQLEAADYQVTLAETGAEAVASATKEVPDLAIVDLRIGEESGIEVLGKLLHIQPTLPVIIATAHATIDTAVEATKKGAYDYITKPFDAVDLSHRLEKALEVSHLRSELEQLRTQVQERYKFDDIIAASEQMQSVLHQVVQIAATESTVCIYGESGTGKELIAKALHVASRRAIGPFVAINCGAIPEGLLENELFGHTKGAYTGADRSKKGLLQQADGGTLLLDEISELPPALQVKFLRVLQEREFYPLGAGQPVKVNIRLVAATNQDLQKLVSQGKFREDLYYRIHVLPIILPPLRERPADIVPLIQYFLQRFTQENNKDVQGFTPEALQRLMLYSWPGNVRELANIIERAVVLSPNSLIAPDMLLLGKAEILSFRSPDLCTLREARERFERNYLIQVLSAVKGHVSRAASLAGKDRAEFYRLLRRHAIVPSAFKEEKGERMTA
ncbi:MAG TPA: sigma-54 dependent transcriptional regulator [Candidatus Binatia bacterium]|jgi:two-component system response regulator GlrR|nr:sigma-54 dependent transcriptional regulator [Candidatus Binatia bacterium]